MKQSPESLLALLRSMNSFARIRHQRNLAARRLPGQGTTQLSLVARAFRGIVMSGRRPLIKGYFQRCASRGCGHVFGLLRGV
jgi:hypothetical protein